VYDYRVPRPPGWPLLGRHALLMRVLRRGRAPGKVRGCELLARGKPLTTAFFDSLQALLSQPIAGIALGLALGTLLFRLSRSSFRRMTPETSAEGLRVVTLLLLGRMFFVLLTLWVYSSLFPDGFVPFALSLAGGFLVLYTFEAIRYGGFLKRRKSHVEVAQGR